MRMLYEIKVPEAGFNIPECIIVEWMRNVGEKVEEGETVVTLESEKLSVDVPAESSGIVSEIRYKEGETVTVGSVIGVISSHEDGPEIKRSVETGTVSGIEKPEHKIAPKSGRKWKGRKISPAAKALAGMKGVDLDKIGSGSGPEGRIVKNDVLSSLSKHKQENAADKTSLSAVSGSQEEKVLLTGWRKVIAERMTRSVREVPQYFQCIEVDVTRLAETVQSLKGREDLPRITYLPFVIKAISSGIDAVPCINALFLEEGYVIKREIHVGVAVDLGEKLVVPVVRNVREKSIVQIAREVGELVRKARSEKIDASDVEGGTITVTNVGGYGLFTGIPIILQPQAAIISMGTVREVPFVKNGLLALRYMLMIGGSFDHRIVNGGPAARFLQEVKKSLEDLDLLMIKMC
jgi:pyruvate/2-oxoglutarate dehydrogenase complex dihydrolipoamide acyltransferase (E2) component